MREIKFRAWDTDNLEMSEPFKLIHDMELYSDQHIVMQYTGLTDKNGKEIYEGDIIKCSYCEKDFGVVEYQTHMHRFGLQWPENKCANARLTDIDHWAEVIGNIYENPELLEMK